MESIPDIIWVLVGLLLLSFLLVVGFNTTLGEFLKTKLAKTIICVIALAIGIAAFVSGIIQIVAINRIGMAINWEKLVPSIALAAIGGIVASSAVLVWFYKVKDIKPTKTRKH